MIVTSMFMNEFRREILLWRAYPTEAISRVAMWAFIYPVLIVILISVAEQSGVTYGERLQSASLIGFLIWKLCSGVFSTIPASLEEEAVNGTLESVLFSSSLSFEYILSCRTIARAMIVFVETAILAIIFQLLFQISLRISLLAVLVTTLTLLGVIGIGFAIAGLAILFKNVSSVTSLIAFLSYSISGAFVPLNSLELVFTILKYIFPMTLGIDILRNIMINGYDLNLVVSDGSLLLLAVQTAAFILLGLFGLKYSLFKAKLQGLLNAY